MRQLSERRFWVSLIALAVILTVALHISRPANKAVLPPYIVESEDQIPELIQHALDNFPESVSEELIYYASAADQAQARELCAKQKSNSDAVVDKAKPERPFSSRSVTRNDRGNLVFTPFEYRIQSVVKVEEQDQNIEPGETYLVTASVQRSDPAGSDPVTKGIDSATLVPTKADAAIKVRVFSSAYGYFLRPPFRQRFSNHSACEMIEQD